MSTALGDYDASTVIYGKFTTYRPSTGAAYTLGGTPALSVYKDNSTTQSTTGVTLTADFDSVTGLNHFAIDTSADGTFYSAGSNFDIVITTGTVDSVSVVGAVVASFTIRKTSALKPTTAGRSLDVSAGGEAGIDWANIGSPTTTVGLSGTTVKTATDVETDTADIQSRLPAALVSGRIDASVGAMAADVVTASAIATDAIGALELAAGAASEIATAVRTELATELGRIDVASSTLATSAQATAIEADTQDIQSRLPAALVGGRIDANVGAISGDATAADNLESYTDGTTPMPVNAIQISGDATAADNLEAAADGTGYNLGGGSVVAASVTGAVGSVTGAVGSVTGAVGSVTGNVGGNVTGSVGSVATGGITRASLAADTGLQTVRSNTAQAGGATTITLDASASATDDFYNNHVVYLTGGTGAGQARFITDYNGTTKVATVTTWTTNPDNTSTFAILPFDAVPGASAPTAAQVADEVQTRTIAAVTVVNGLAANVITAAATAADFTTEIQAGLATAAALDAVDNFVDTEVAAIKTVVDAIQAKTDNLPSDPADASDIAAAVAAIQSDTNDIQSRLPAALVDGKMDSTNSDTVVRGTVGSGSTTTSIVTSAFSPSGAVADQYKGRIVVFDNDTTTAALRGQATDITASSSAATPVLTVTALTTAPASTDSFSVL